MLCRLVYFSARACADVELETLRDAAAGRNKRSDIRSLLMADADTFIQAIEGPRGAVSALFQEISRDPRHTQVVLVEMSEIAAYTLPRNGLTIARDAAKIDEAWTRVTRRRTTPWPLSALQLRGLLKIALIGAEPTPAMA